MSSEALILLNTVLIILAIIYGNWNQSTIWASKAKTGIRKEYKGKLYFVIEDGDHEALNNVNKWFKT